MKLYLGRAVLAGLGGTVVMTMLMLLAPAMGMPPMDIGKMLAPQMGGVLALGWMAHFVIGVLLALIYAGFFADRLPGAPALRGALYGLLPWLAAQVAVMPMMGMGLFSGSMAMAGGSLMGHLVYGAALGLIYGAGREQAVNARHAHA